MNVNTGEIYTPDEADRERKRGTAVVDIPRGDLDRVKAMDVQSRRKWAAEQKRKAAKRKERRKQRRKSR